MKTCVLEVDLARRVADRAGLGGYDRARIVLRYGHRVIGEVTLPVEEGLLLGSAIQIAVNDSKDLSRRLSATILEERITASRTKLPLPTWTLVICTRDRPEMLRRCLSSVFATQPTYGQVVVVDNASSSGETQAVAAEFPVVYVSEDRPGLNRARLLGARVASGDVVVYADDDTVASEGWIEGLLEQFEGARVGAVTGLTMPFELETDAQELFEVYGGFGKGFERREYELASLSPSNAGAVGSGANMAFRRDLILSEGHFEPKLDLGTPSKTGGDTYALYRIMRAGFRVVYTPDALNWHVHRRTREELRRTLAGYGTGLYTFLLKNLVEDRELAALRVGLRWFRIHHVRELLRSIARRPNRLPVDVIMAEIRGTFAAPFAYASTRRVERAARAAAAEEDAA